MSANKENSLTHNLQALTSEKSNRQSSELDLMDSETILRTMNREDKHIAQVVEMAIPQITNAVDLIVSRFQRNGRLIYVGAGTSGRLAAIDALECPPTFGISPEQVSFQLAGGDEAMLLAVEGAEDNTDQGAEDLRIMNLRPEDCVAAISASGRTPYCLGAMQYARTIGAATISICCNSSAEMSKLADAPIEIVTGPEVLAGSTRLKAGTAQKLVLNMLSTASMVRTGRVYGNLMIDMQTSNVKLRQRAIQIVVEVAGVDSRSAELALQEADWNLKKAIVCLITGSSVQEAEHKLQVVGGFLRRAIGEGLSQSD